MSKSNVRATVGVGQLSEWITFEAETRGNDGYGGATQSWAPVASVWAAVEPLYVAERESQGAVRNVTQYRFTIYRRDDLNEQMRIVWAGRSFNVRGIKAGAARDLVMDIIAETGAGN